MWAPERARRRVPRLIVLVSSPPQKEPAVLEKLFKFKQNGTTLTRDTVAGLTTFMVMSYIIFVNPVILGFVGIKDLESEGLPFAAVLTSTCLVAGVMTLIMGLYTNRAYALAPGMGLNAVVAFSLVAAGGLTMKGAMGIILMEGIVITILVLTGFREAISSCWRASGRAPSCSASSSRPSSPRSSTTPTTRSPSHPARR
jgi:AGZA family xanthine/uracil permease-like MFS transporter